MIFLELILKNWKLCLIGAVLAASNWYSYNWGYDRREAIAEEEAQQYSDALQESLRKKYVFEQVFVPKYIKLLDEQNDKTDRIVDEIGKIPEREVANCRVPDDAIRLFNESVLDYAGPTAGIDGTAETVPANPAE